MPLDPTKRYLVARPRGGLNDALARLEIAARYAEKFERVLILDMLDSGLREPLDAVFEVTRDFGPELIIWNEDVAKDVDASTSVHPAFVQHRISNLRCKYSSTLGMAVDEETEQPIKFDLSMDHEAKVLVYQQSGGGLGSFRALKRMKLRADVADEVVARLGPLGRGYDAIHVRHSDYKTNFRRFLLRMRPLLHHRRVLICSDSVAAKDAAERILHSSTTVMSVANIPDIGLKPLHHTRTLDAHERTLDFLSDLIGMALSDRLFFTHVINPGSLKKGYSGFSLLAEILRRNPDVVRQLLANAEKSAVKALFQLPMGQDGIYRRCQIWGQERARSSIKKLAKRFERMESGQVIHQHRIPPI